MNTNCTKVDRDSPEYLDYLSIAKNIFSNDSISEDTYSGIPYFEVRGRHFFENCHYTILQYDCEFIYIPQKLIYDGNRIYPAKTNTDNIATMTDDLLSYYKPSKELFTEKCYYLLHLIKEMQNKLRMENIKYDF
jgi:hypothetical protein